MRRISSKRSSTPFGQYGLALLGSIVMLTGCSTNPGTDEAATPIGRPLDAYLGGPNGEPTADTTEQQRQVQELIAACMKVEGFEYIPLEPADPEDFPVFAEADRAWTQEYGYGITTIGGGLAAVDNTDPNTAIVDAMDESERTSYFDALWGPPVANDGGSPVAVAAAPAGGGAFTSMGTAGCAGKAHTEIFGEVEPIDFADYESLFADLADLEQKVEQDSRVLPAIAQWSDCMADADYPGLTAVSQARDSIMQEWADLNGWEFQSGGEGGMAQGMSVTVDSAVELPELDKVKVAELRTKELAMALADFDCAADYRTIRDQVRFELETAFIADHLVELEKYRDAINAGN